MFSNLVGTRKIGNRLILKVLCLWHIVPIGEAAERDGGERTSVKQTWQNCRLFYERWPAQDFDSWKVSILYICYFSWVDAWGSKLQAT